MGHKQLIWLLVIFWLLPCLPAGGYLGDCIFAQTTFDPMTIGAGARALGMGKAYVAVAEDGDTIFTNPAGLGEIDNFQFTSMAGTVMEELNYSILGGVYPIGGKQAIGIGYVCARVGGIELRNTSGTLFNISDYENYVLFASYGRKLTEKLSLGISLKRFVQDGVTINEGDGSGVNLDIGFLQRGLGWLSVGAVAQNILNSSKISYQNGEEETLPRTLKVGAKMHILGQKYRAARISPLELVLVIDADLSLQASRPTLVHLGCELSPSDTLTLRAGIDQDPQPGGIKNTGTLGLSFKFAGVGFHYAFHPYSETNSETHYISLTFDERGWPPKGLPDVFLGMEPGGPVLQK